MVGTSDWRGVEVTLIEVCVLHFINFGEGCVFACCEIFLLTG